MTLLRHWPGQHLAPSRVVAGPTPCRTCAYPVAWVTDTVAAFGAWWELYRTKSGELVIARRHGCIR